MDNSGDCKIGTAKEYSFNQLFSKIMWTLAVSAFIFTTFGWFVGRETGKALMLKKALDKGYAKKITYTDADNNTKTYIGWNDDNIVISGNPEPAPKPFGDVKKMSDEEFQKLKAREDWAQSAHIMKIIREMTPQEKQEVHDALKKLDGEK